MNFVQSTFKNQEIVLDFNEFQGCRFENCLMIFAGNGPVSVKECVFINTQWALVGAAQRTFNFFVGMYHGSGEGGKQLIEQLFDAIKSGRTIGPVQTSPSATDTPQQAVAEVTT